MTTLIYSHRRCLEHDPGPDHPESPARLTAVLAALEDPEFAGLEWRDAPAASLDQIGRVHSERYIDDVYQLIQAGEKAQLDEDTYVSAGSWHAALHASGAVCAAIDAVIREDADNAFCAVRPPGHHAEPERAMGFCIFNNIAIGAFQAREIHNIGRIAIVDFDVHHGNGTEVLLRNDPDLFYASIHQEPLFPGTGRESDRGRFNNVLNVPLRPKMGSSEFRQQARNRVLPTLAKFEPQLILISAGFDGHRADPLSDLSLDEDDFAWITSEILTIACHACRGRVVSVLEGGYDPNALAASVAAHVRALKNG